LECREWHLNGHRTDNEMHPTAPAKIGYECPYCALRDAPQSNHVLQEVAR
jgi:hypothetical protein